MQNYSKTIFKNAYFVYNSMFKRNTFCLHQFKNNNFDQKKNLILYQHYTTQKTHVKSIKKLDDLMAYVNNGQQFHLKHLTNIFDNINFESISSKEMRVLLEFCGNSLYYSSKATRNIICQRIYENLIKYNTPNEDIYDTYIKICTENDVLLNFEEFLKSMNCTPSQKTYKLLLNNVCESGNIEHSITILEIMKKENIPVDEEVFNNLALAYASREGLKGGETILSMMKTAQIPETDQTKLSIYKGVIKRNNFDEFKTALEKYPIVFNEEQYLSVLEWLGLSGNHLWLPELKNKVPVTNVTREFLNNVENICIHCISMKQVDSAVAIYEFAMDSSYEENYGASLLKEMLYKKIDTNKIVNIAKSLQDKKLNLYALENVTGIALKNKFFDEAWILISNLKNIKPHYFWPLLINAFQTEGENGLLNSIEKINNMNVKLDFDSLEFYVFRLCDLKNPKHTLEKLKGLGYSIRELLSPLLLNLLRQNNIKTALELCESFNVLIGGERFLSMLSNCWINTKDTKSVIILLQKFCESNISESDHVGAFLIRVLKTSKTSNVDDFKKLIEHLTTIKLRINNSSLDSLHQIILHKGHGYNELLKRLDKLLDFSLKTEKNVRFKHPQNMNLDELEAHLIELEEKNMETRGVLRKLIQQHCQLGNESRVQELRQKFTTRKYKESAGMKCSIMHSYVQGKHLKEALDMYNELKDSFPTFRIDSFKIIDLVTLMVKENKFSDARQILKSATETEKALANEGVVHNCFDLLNCFTNVEEQQNTFNILVNRGYCKPNNIILGPLIRLLMKRNVKEAANKYIEFTIKYKCTPLQIELLSEIIELKDENLLQSVIKATKNVHGVAATQAALITVLAQKGLEVPLKKHLTTVNVPINNEMNNRFKRWVHERNINALKTMLKATENINVVDRECLTKCIMEIFEINNDWESALEFYEELLENENILYRVIENNIRNLSKKCNVQLPNHMKLNNTV